MPYVRKTSDRLKFKAGWLKRRRPALLASGLTERQLQIIEMRDMAGLTLKQAGSRLGFSGTLVRQEYERALRRLRHPQRWHLLPEISPAFPGQILPRTK